MGYRQALEAAGASVVEYKTFGSYQGDWFAYLSNGNVVHGYYGSCSGCDAFEAEFGYDEDEDKGNYQRRLADFGANYLRNPESLKEAIARYERKGDDWEEDTEILNWLKSLS